MPFIIFLHPSVVTDRLSKFFAAQIRQNEFRVSYDAVVVPAQAAWMFHIILTLLDVVGFEGDDVVVLTGDGPTSPKEGLVARTQTAFFLGAALSTYVKEMKAGIPSILDYQDYDPSEYITQHFAQHCKPIDLPRLAVLEHPEDAYELSEMLNNWYGRKDEEIRTTRMPSTMEAVVEAKIAEESGLRSTLNDVNQVNLLGSPFPVSKFVPQSRRARRTGGKPQPYSRDPEVRVKSETPPSVFAPRPTAPIRKPLVGFHVVSRALDFEPEDDDNSSMHSSMPSLQTISGSPGSAW